MNTADRSIAVIDYALRRRFVFLDVPADDRPIHQFPFEDSVTREAALHLRATTSAALNTAAAGLQVGPSYFLAKANARSSSLEALASRFVYEVLPLLAEYAMEGEIDAAVIPSLRQALGLPEGGTQHELAALLASHLHDQPWLAPDLTGADPV